MNKLSNTSRMILLAVVIVAAAGLIIWFNGSSQGGPNLTDLVNATNTLQQAANANNNTTSTAPAVPAKSGGNGSPAKTTGAPSAPAPIVFVTPVPGETWKIATSNPIQWSREGGVTGQIEFLDASTKQLVGVILVEIGPHQTSYEWNTRDMYLSRTNPLKKTVVPGRYLIRIAFDGNNLSPITSQPITLEQ